MALALAAGVVHNFNLGKKSHLGKLGAKIFKIKKALVQFCRIYNIMKFLLEFYIYY